MTYFQLFARFGKILFSNFFKKKSKGTPLHPILILNDQVGFRPGPHETC
jgi:hypothetical protein